MENHNPWSFDNFINQGTQQIGQTTFATIHEIRLQYEHELEKTKLQHEQWRRDIEILHIQEIQRMEREVNEKFHTMTRKHEEEMKQLRESANEQFKSLMKTQEEQILRLTEIHQKTVIDSEKTIATLKLELKEAESNAHVQSTRLQEQQDIIQNQTFSLHEKEESNKSLANKVAEQQAINEKLEEENISLQRKVKKFSAKLTKDELDSHSEIAQQDAVNNRSHSSTQEDDYWDVPSDHDDVSSNYSMGTTTSYRLARELARAEVPSVKVNAVHAEKSRQKARHVTPPFSGVGARGWLQQFRKLIKYHRYSNEEALMEMMISMQGAANDWWLTLSEAQQNDLDQAIQAFQAFYGGEEDAMAHALQTLPTLIQGDQPMHEFGPRLLLTITTITKDNFQLQMQYFYRAINPKLRSSVMHSRPKNIHEAINSAIEAERSIRNNMPAIPVMPKPSGENSWNQPTSTNDDPMDIDVNAQRSYQDHKRSSKKSASYDKNKKKSCFVCDKDNHLARDCYYLKKAKAAVPNSDKKHKKPNNLGTHRSNLQQVTSVQSGSISSDPNQTNENDSVDLTDNLFYQLYKQNSQSLENLQDVFEDYIPEEIGGSKRRTNFSLHCLAQANPSGPREHTEVLIDCIT
ncbi:hypothetical protein EDC96DRAFT_237220 [Choanephora cucurbitarum]|nr:hypothetical protein EDC96DRAFT_237220 [Choanephora cucurbitarum]